MSSLIASVLLTCTISPGDDVKGWYLYHSPAPVESVDDATWFNFSTGSCAFDVAPNFAVGKCWYITAVGAGADDEPGTFEESLPAGPACLVITIDRTEEQGV